jgi:deoxyadenosine/deoxycytidine kinase
MNRSIAVAGNIGAGKSTLVEFLERHYGIVAFYEPNEENPYLEDFYRDMRGFAFHSQLYFLASKFRLHQAFERQAGVVALDRTIFEDAEVFATALYQMQKISKRDWATYRSLYEGILQAIRPPDLLIYLRCSIPMLRRRIRLRGRAMEQGMSLAYVRRLQGLYDDWIARYRLSDVLVLETDRLDYVNDLVHRLDVMRRIEQVLPRGFSDG